MRNSRLIRSPGTKHHRTPPYRANNRLEPLVSLALESLQSHWIGVIQPAWLVFKGGQLLLSLIPAIWLRIEHVPAAHIANVCSWPFYARPLKRIGICFRDINHPEFISSCKTSFTFFSVFVRRCVVIVDAAGSAMPVLLPMPYIVRPLLIRYMKPLTHSLGTAEVMRLEFSNKNSTIQSNGSGGVAEGTMI